MTNVLQERLNLIVLERAQLARQFRDQGGRGVEIAERIDRLDEQIAQLDGATMLACPQCGGYEELADVTMYPGVCGGEYVRLANGTIDFSGDGDTEIIWDAGEEPEGKKSVQCEACGWVGRRDQLGEPRPEDEDDEFECEDCSVNGLDCRVHGEAAKAAMRAVHANPTATLSVLKAGGLA
jgi:hypothetical protein